MLFFISSCSNAPLKNIDTQNNETDNIIKVAVLNFKIEGLQDLESHLKRVEAFAVEAKTKGAKYLLLPELMVFDMLPINPPEQKMQEYLTALSNLSKEYETSLKRMSIDNKLSIIGASVVVKIKNKFINRSFYISADVTALY